MTLDSRVKGGLAWLGLVVVLAVPAADMVMGKGGNQVVPAVPETATALKLPKAPARGPTATATADDPVARRLASGKGLPSYISDRKPDEVASQDGAPTPKPVLAASAKPLTVAAVPQQDVTPPLPLPRNARPKGTLMANTANAADEPLVLDEAAVRANEQSGAEPFPISGEDNGTASGRPADWNTESLADYLARQELISDSGGEVLDQYDPDGFYLDEGPNSTRPRRQQQSLDWLLF